MYEGTAEGFPVVGLGYRAGGLYTSTVVKIIDNHHFETKNSIYHFEIVKDDKAHEVHPGGLGESKSFGEDILARAGIRRDDVPIPKGGGSVKAGPYKPFRINV